MLCKVLVLDFYVLAYIILVLHQKLHFFCKIQEFVENNNW